MRDAWLSPNSRARRWRWRWSAHPKGLPIGALLALAMTGFICIVTETLPAGLLPLISEGLAISPSMAGQMVTAYALGSVLAVIPMTIATRCWRRRNVLLLTETCVPKGVGHIIVRLALAHFCSL